MTFPEATKAHKKPLVSAITAQRVPPGAPPMKMIKIISNLMVADDFILRAELSITLSARDWNTTATRGVMRPLHAIAATGAKTNERRRIR